MDAPKSKVDNFVNRGAHASMLTKLSTFIFGEYEYTCGVSTRRPGAWEFVSSGKITCIRCRTDVCF